MAAFSKLFRISGDKSTDHSSELTLLRYRREFGWINGTKWFCLKVPFDEAKRRHEALKGPTFEGMFGRQKAGLNVAAAMQAELDSSANSDQPGEPRAEATCPECGKQFEPDKGPDGRMPDIVTCPKCATNFNPASEPEPTDYESDGGDKLASVFKIRQDG